MGDPGESGLVTNGAHQCQFRETTTTGDDGEGVVNLPIRLISICGVPPDDTVLRSGVSGGTFEIKE